MNKIDFIGIGAQKAATSWLWSNLNQHPEIWMPPRKELHYFDRDLSYPSPSFLATDSLFERLVSLAPHNVLFRKKAFTEIKELIKSKRYSVLAWYMKYYFSNYNDEWYSNLFEVDNSCIKGEVTPAYSILSREDIEHIKKTFPHLKVILNLRNPIERAWSQVKFYKTRNIHNIKDEKDALISFIESPLQTTRGNYLSIVRNWREVFGENLSINLYDTILEDPEGYMQNIYKFLEVKHDTKLFTIHRVNKSIDIEMPLYIKKYLESKYREEIKILSEYLEDERVLQWLNEV